MLLGPHRAAGTVADCYAVVAILCSPRRQIVRHPNAPFCRGEADRPSERLSRLLPRNIWAISGGGMSQRWA